MPKIIGFLAILVSTGFLMSAVFDAIKFFIKFGATNKEILAMIITAMIGGGTIVLFLLILWG